MVIHLYRLQKGVIKKTAEISSVKSLRSEKDMDQWVEITEADPKELEKFLAPLNLHPLQLRRCLDKINDPGVISFGSSVLMEYPAAFDQSSRETSFLSIILKDHLLVTLRHGKMPALDDFIQELCGKTSLNILHLSQLLYMILDEFADLNVDAQVALRDQIQIISDAMWENPKSIRSADLFALRNQVEDLVSLFENQLYCVSNLNACDNKILQDPHRKAYIQDLLSETEIAQRGIYRLETRIKDLFSDFQAVGNDLVEKRLRLLTIVSAITLPLGLIAGLLGMNVGGVPGTSSPVGFIIVIGIMLIISILQFLYFKRKGWFD